LGARNFAYIAVTTPADMEKFGIGWSLRLTGESGWNMGWCLPQLGGTGRHKFSVADGTADATPAAVVGAIPEKKAATGAVQTSSAPSRYR